MRIRAYRIDPDEKRHMRRLYPDVAFDWKKITQQLAEKCEDCRRYRTRPRKATRRSSLYDDDPVFGVYEPSTRTIYTSGIPSSAAGVGWLLDAVLQFDRERATGPPSAGIMRKLQVRDKPTTLARALAEIGRIAKTVHQR